MKNVPAALLTALLVQVLCQVFKVVLYSVREARFAPEYFVSAGGFPSAHSAFVTALSAAVGLRGGFGSDLFAVSFVFSVIVIYDAYRLRGAVEKHAKLLNRLAADLRPGVYPRLSEMVGHTLPEIAAGVAAGGILGVVVTGLLAASGL